MPFSIRLLDKQEVLDARDELASQKLRDAPEPKVIELSYDKPLALVERQTLSDFSNNQFYRDMLRTNVRDRLTTKKMQAQLQDNPRIKPEQAELERMETADKVTVYYHGRTGVLNAMRTVGMFTQDTVAETMINEVNQFLQTGSPAPASPPAAPAKKTRKR